MPDEVNTPKLIVDWNVVNTSIKSAKNTDVVTPEDGTTFSNKSSLNEKEAHIEVLVSLLLNVLMW